MNWKNVHIWSANIVYPVNFTGIWMHSCRYCKTLKHFWQQAKVRNSNMFQNFWCCRLWINKSFSFEKTRLLTTSEICPLDTFCAIKIWHFWCPHSRYMAQYLNIRTHGECCWFDEWWGRNSFKWYSILLLSTRSDSTSMVNGNRTDTQKRM